MMKKILTIAMVVLLAFGAVSCSKDAPIEGGDNPGTKRSLVFKFNKMNGGATSYAQIAQGAESTLSNATVYLFETTSNKLSYVQSATFDASNPNMIDVGIREELQGDTYHAYIVANNLDGTTENKFVDLTTLEMLLEDGSNAVTATNEEDFLNKVTSAITGNIDGSLFLMSGFAAEDNGAIKAIQPFGNYSVTLIRRVARFDLRNMSSAAIKIQKVVIKNAVNIGHMIGSSTYDITTDPSYAFMSDIDIDCTTTSWTNVSDNSTPPKVLYADATSVFYLNPTSISGKTQIFIEAKVGNETKIFELRNSLTQISINANHRYILAIAEDFTFSISVADWSTDANEILPTAPSGHTFGMAAAPIVVGGTYNGNIVVLPNTTPVTVTFDIKASSTLGTTYEVIPMNEAGFETYDATKITAAVVQSNTITYSAPYFAANYTVTVSEAIDAAKSFSSVLRIKDVASGATIDLNIYHLSQAVIDSDLFYLATNLKPVTIGGYIFAPVNVGANVNVSSILDVNLVGYHYQWGRNQPFNTFESASIVTTMGPLSAADAALTTDYIITPEPLADWLSPSDDGLWYASTNNHPCPTGWRLPSATEFNKILEKITADGHLFTNNSLVVKGDDGGTLYLPFGGSINASTVPVGSYGPGEYGVYWTTQNTGGSQIFAWQYVVEKPRVMARFASPRRSAYTLRCIKQ